MDWKNPVFLSKKIITILVFVHVIYKTTFQNISQFDVLNRDFRKLNIDTINTHSEWKQITSDCEIEFCLATTDPNRNSTKGLQEHKKAPHNLACKEMIWHLLLTED